MLQEQLIEAAAIDVIGVVLGNAQLGNLAETQRTLLAVGPVDPVGAVLAYKPPALQDGQKSKVLKEPGRGTDQRLADVSPGVDGLVEDQVIDAGLGKVGPERRAGRAAANDDDVSIAG